MTMRRLLSLSLLVNLFFTFFVLGGNAASAGVPTCQGSPATAGHLGTNSNDNLLGSPGDDVIIGTGGADTIDGKGGNDIICGGEDDNTPDGKDVIRGGPGQDTLLGGKGDDKVYGEADRDNLFGGPGDDRIDGGSNPFGIGDDADYFFTSNSIVGDLGKGTAKGEGNDQLFGIEGFGGGSGDDRFVGDKNQNAFSGGAGLFGPTGDDTFIGKGGIDTLSSTFATTSVFVSLEGGTSAGDGADTFSSIENVIGSDQSDTLIGSSVPNVIVGAGGHDAIYGRAGDDIFIGYSGDDQIYGGVGIADFASYSDSPGLVVNINLMNGTAMRLDGDDVLEGIEMLDGSAQDDEITGDNGPNFFFGDEGDDDIDGKGGSDLIFFLSATGPVVADLGLGTATGMAETFDEIDNVEHMVGGSYADNLTGDDKRNFLNGSSGADWVKGVEGDDYLAGGPGNDIVEGGDGDLDLLDFFQSKTAVTLNLGDTGPQNTGEGTDTITGVEGASGTPKNDELRGAGEANSLYGQNGADDLFGLGGDDRLDGGKKTDSLSGGPNTDECFTKSEATGCESFKKPGEHPLTEVGRRYKRALASARRYK